MNHDVSFHGKRVCFIGAHPDDIELGAGALIARIAPISDVFCITLSDNQKNPALSNLKQEQQRSMKQLGVPEKAILLGHFETRRFQLSRQEILEHLIEFNNKHQPDIIFTHTKSDLHQDHSVVTEEVLRAFRGTTVLGFDVIRSSHGFFPTFFVEVGDEDVKKKIAALAEYKTYADKYYFDPDVTRATLIRHGALVERKFAEAFDICRIIGVFEK
jgi:LmbE family N-acetylglucosaminyl deacetylase